MKVLHAPAEIAGQASVLARGLRAIGIEAHSLAYNPGFPHYRPDEMKPYDDLPAWPRYGGYLRSLAKHLSIYCAWTHCTYANVIRFTFYCENFG